MGFGGLATLEWDETFRGTEQKERKQSLNKMSQSWEERFSTDKESCTLKGSERKKENEHKICKISNVQPVSGLQNSYLHQVHFVHRTN